jgi:hypothetical protein
MVILLYLLSAVRINSDSGTLTIGGTISNGSIGLTFGGAGNITVNGVIGNGAGTVTKDGAGTLTLTADIILILEQQLSLME